MLPEDNAIALHVQAFPICCADMLALNRGKSTGHVVPSRTNEQLRQKHFTVHLNVKKILQKLFQIHRVSFYNGLCKHI